MRRCSMINSRFLLLVLLISLPLLINVLILRGQTDPFYSTTVVQAVMITNDGRIGDFKIDPGMALFNWYWQGHTSSYTQWGLIAPALTTSILSIITGINPLKVLFTPITFILSILCLMAILRRVISNADTHSKLKLFRSLLMIVAIYMWVSEHTIGRFWTLQYHAYSHALYLTCLLIICLILHSSFIFQSIILFVLLFTTVVMTHYRAPYALIGGAIGFEVALLLIQFFGRENNSLVIKGGSLRSQMFYIIIMCTAVLYFFNFYIGFVGGKVDLNRLFYGIFEYLRELRRSTTFGEDTDIQSHTIFLESVLKLFTYLNIGIIFTYFSMMIFSLLKRRHLDNANIAGLLLYSYALFSSSVTFLAYFYVYGPENRFSFIDPWLMIVLPVYLYTVKLNSKIRKTWKIMVVIIHMILILCGFLLGVNNLRIWTSYNSLTPPPPSVNVLGEFFTNFISPDRLHITMSSISTASKIYAEVSDQNYSIIQHVIFANIYINSSDISSTIDVIRRSSNYIIVTVFDLNYGLYTDINIAKNFIREKSVKEFFYHLVINESIIFNNNNYFVFLLS